MNLKYNGLNFPSIYKTVVEIEINQLDKYLETLEVGYLDQSEGKKKELSKDYVQDDWELQEIISEQLNELEEVFQYGEIFLIIGLYRIVELNRKKIFRMYLENIEVEKLSYFNYLESEFKESTGSEITNIANHESIDELRLLNNCLKHSGKVNDDLANYDGWIEGEKIESVKDNFKNLKKDVPEYIYDLAIKLKTEG